MKKAILKVIDNFELYICYVTLVVSLVVLFVQVVLRYVFDNATSWSEEVGRYCLIWLIFLGTSFAVKNEAHIRIDAALLIWPKKIRPIILEIGDGIWFLFNLLMVYVSTFYTKEIFSMGSIAPGLKIPIGYIYAAIPLGFLLMDIRMVQVKCGKLKGFLEKRRNGKEDEG
ncbi:MAG: TRAP transporter small permease [Lachnospiraceae bacterium]|jgi:TRAP-type C4-dicarboxylate transport system permease small subunit|nr:TRAP transporter small permease [Lachnospiraceae bacterium]